MESNGGRATQSLVERAQRIASEYDLDIAGAAAGACRFGPVDLLLHTAEGDIYAKATVIGPIHLTVWVFGELTAWGQTPELAEVVKLFDRWKGHATPAQLGAAFPWLTTATATPRLVSSMPSGTGCSL